MRRPRRRRECRAPPDVAERVVLVNQSAIVVKAQFRLFGPGVQADAQHITLPKRQPAIWLRMPPMPCVVVGLEIVITCLELPVACLEEPGVIPPSQVFHHLRLVDLICRVDSDQLKWI